MPSTPNMALPYPAATDAPDGPGAFYALAKKFDQLGASWTPAIDGVAASTEASGWYMRVSGFCFAYGFLRTADGNYPASASNLLNLPIPSLSVAGVPYSIGEVDYTLRSGGQLRLGHVMQNGSSGGTGAKALLYVDNVSGTQVSPQLAVAGTPYTVSSTDALYFNFRLRYWVGV